MTQDPPDDPGYQVGRGRPPTSTQFPKGRSGNPKGRPKKPIVDVDVVAASVNDLVLGEAYRVITLTEGGKPVSLPAGQAVLKAMVVTGLKGNPQAQRNFTQLVANAEAQRDKAKGEFFAQAYSLKVEIELRQRRWAAMGREEDLDIHPSDIELDWEKGQARLYLLFTEEHRNSRAKALKLLEEQQAILKRSWATIAEEGDDYLLQLGRQLARSKIHVLNEYLPPRLREEPHPSLGDDQHPTPEAGCPRPLKRRRRTAKVSS